ncbi:MAG: competence protein ComEA [Gammaproteobacteria bacterium]|jgi:competence protein ComEA
MFNLSFSRITSFAAAMLFSFSVWAGPVNINSADADALAANLVGVGDKIAAAIVADREQNGPFSSIEELMRVKGIGVKTLEKNRESLQLEGSSEDS